MHRLRQIILALGLSVAVLFLALIFVNIKNDSALNPEQDELALGDLNLSTNRPSQTALAAKELAELLMANNPDGPALIDGEYGISTLSPEKIADQILTSKINEASTALLDVAVDKRRLIVVPDTDEAFWSYLTKSSEAMRDNSLLVKSQNVNLAEPSALDFQLLARIYEKMADDLYVVAVPKKLEKIHTEQLRLLLINQNIFEALANFEADPLTASVAISLLQRVEEDMASLNGAIADIINKYQG